MMSISNHIDSTWAPVEPQQGAGHRWFANVPLSTSSNTPLQVSFQNNAVQTNFSLAWVPRNVLEGGTLRIRQGDSVMFTAMPQDATNGTIQIQIEDGPLYTATVVDGDPITHAFTNAGTFLITGNHEDGASTNGTMTIQVIGGGFPATAPACMINKTRTWECPDLPASVFLETGPSINLSRSANTLSINARSTNRRHVLLARLDENGTILAATDIQAFWVQAAVDNYMRIVERHEDYQIWENTIITRNLPDSVDLLINVFVSGVTLDDMQLQRWINRADLDELGAYSFNLIHSNEIQTSACHTIKMYQFGQLIGEAYYSGRLFIDE